LIPCTGVLYAVITKMKRGLAKYTGMNFVGVEARSAATLILVKILGIITNALLSSNYIVEAGSKKQMNSSLYY